MQMVSYGRKKYVVGSEEHISAKIRLNEQYKKHGDKRRKYAREKTQRKKERNKQYVFNYLSSRVCESCGESNTRVLTFDHIDQKEKFKPVSTMCVQGYSLEMLKKEISKCRILCANCHTIHTMAQVGGSYHDRMKVMSEEDFENIYGDLL